MSESFLGTVLGYRIFNFLSEQASVLTRHKHSLSLVLIDRGRRCVLDRSRFVTGQLFFVLAQLLLHFLYRTVQRGDYSRRLRRRYEIVGVLSRHIDFDVRLFLMLEIDSDFNRVDSIKYPSDSLSFLADHFLVMAAQRTMACGDVDLHLIELHVVRVRLILELAKRRRARSIAAIVSSPVPLAKAG